MIHQADLRPFDKYFFIEIQILEEFHLISAKIK